MDLKQLKEKFDLYNTGNLPEGDTARFLVELHNADVLQDTAEKYRREFSLYHARREIILDEHGKASVNEKYHPAPVKPAPAITLKAEKLTAWYVDYNDLDKFLSKVFDVDYEVVAYEELGNDVAKTFNVESKPLDDYYKKKLEQKSLHYMTALLLDEACHRGLIEPGKYVVKVSW